MITTRKVHGPDIFEGEANVDFKALAKSGAKFAIFKINEGDYMDSRATVARVKAIREAGLVAGAYVFMRPKAGRTGAQEFQIFYNKGLSLGLWKRDKQTVRDIRPVLDCEATGFNTDTVLGRLQTRRYIRSAIKECKRLTGHLPIIYTGKWWWEDTIKCRWSLGCPLWLASYPNNPKLPLPSSYLPSAWKEAALWQFTDSHSAPGINNPCDYNVYVGKGGLAGFRTALTF